MPMDHELLARMKNVSRLPSLPAVAVRVLELSRNPSAGAAEIAKVVSADPALSAKILRTVNSSFYALPMQVSTLGHAAALLGVQSVKTLALGFSLVSGIGADRSENFDYNRFWRQSLFSAAFARTLAKFVSCPQHEEAFVAGLLSDVGTLVMHRALGSDYDELLAQSGGDQTELVRLSRARFDLDHAQVGGMLAEHWNLPRVLVEPIRQHHELAGPRAVPPGVTEVVHGGVVCAQVFAADRPGLLDAARAMLRDGFGFDPARSQQLFAEAESRAGQLVETFDLRVAPGRTFAEIESDALQVLTELSLDAQMQSQEIRRQNEKLIRQATIDALTGLANRSRLIEFLAAEFERSNRTAAPLAVLFIDVDRFKAVNDAHGHQAGDAVLAHLGRVLRAGVRRYDLAARYGGEEMVLVLPGLDAAAAGHVAERVRRAVESQPVEHAGRRVRVTVSVGVAAHDGARAFGSPDALLAAADRALYAAKSAGRNRVRFANAAGVKAA